MCVPLYKIYRGIHLLRIMNNVHNIAIVSYYHDAGIVIVVTHKRTYPRKYDVEN